MKAVVWLHTSGALEEGESENFTCCCVVITVSWQKYLSWLALIDLSLFKAGCVFIKTGMSFRFIVIVQPKEM